MIRMTPSPYRVSLVVKRSENVQNKPVDRDGRVVEVEPTYVVYRRGRVDGITVGKSVRQARHRREYVHVTSINSRTIVVLRLGNVGIVLG